MDSLIIIAIVAFSASMLTFFSGFGLGTILTPFFALFFPVETAIMLTAIVHFLNNIFKLILTGRNIQKTVLIRFGLAAIIGSYAGAQLLLSLPEIEPIYVYPLGEKMHEISLINIIVAALMIVFSIVEIVPSFSKISFDKNKLIAGGMISGFFGGLSGHQGALRSMFLLKLNLAKEAFIATGIAIACFVDVSRLSVYLLHSEQLNLALNYPYLLAGIIPAFAGAYLGNKFLKKITLKVLQIFVSISIIILALALGFGLL